jgi:hypothetical protein
MQRAGRLAWRGLRLRAPPVSADGPRVWPMVLPDVFSIRHTTVDDFVEPIVHEVKVRRADLLADLRQEGKRAAYQGLASQCWYVLRAGIGTADDVPPDCGVLIAHDHRLDVDRPAPAARDAPAAVDLDGAGACRCRTGRRRRRAGLAGRRTARRQRGRLMRLLLRPPSTEALLHRGGPASGWGNLGLWSAD